MGNILVMVCGFFTNPMDGDVVVSIVSWIKHLQPLLGVWLDSIGKISHGVRGVYQYRLKIKILKLI